MRLIKVVFEGTAEEYLVVREQFATDPLAPLPDLATAAIAGPETVLVRPAPDVTTEGPAAAPAAHDTKSSSPPVMDDSEDAATSAAADARDVEMPVASTSPAEDIRRVLQRDTFPDSVRRLFQEVAVGGEAGVARSAVREALGLTDGQLNGVLGTLGRRINATPDLQFEKGKGTSLALVFDVWNDDGWHYRLKPDARQVLADEGVI